MELWTKWLIVSRPIIYRVHVGNPTLQYYNNTLDYYNLNRNQPLSKAETLQSQLSHLK
jgi:hypothetical protein